MVAFTSDRGGLPQLVVSDPHGERQTVLTSGSELMTPAWGPLPAE
jgi:Tol biopolymer transport system component